jgi:anhydro-N-acetylmuramic acid kinase
MKSYKVLGIMSGTSLDGLDLAYCEFSMNSYKWNFSIKAAQTIEYSTDWRQRMANAFDLNGYDLIKLDKEFGHFVGIMARNFLKKNKLKVDFISSHGHTIFHRPDEKVTWQMGCGAAIAAETGITTVCDFRTLDVALNGQGAPLVPIGDMLLFNDFDYCLNLGGFANTSYTLRNKRIAYDICPVNIVLNHYSRLLGLEYDNNGDIGRNGIICENLLNELNKLPFYSQKQPKSLGKEWVDNQLLPVIEKYNISIEDKLRTFYEHFIFQLVKIFKGSNSKKILISGGGAHNSFIIELLKQKSKHQIVIPDKLLIDFKEALIFAFLGVLRIREQHNCLASVTGANHDNFGGAIYKV